MNVILNYKKHDPSGHSNFKSFSLDVKPDVHRHVGGIPAVTEQKDSLTVGIWNLITVENQNTYIKIKAAICLKFHIQYFLSFKKVFKNFLDNKTFPKYFCLHPVLNVSHCST